MPPDGGDKTTSSAVEQNGEKTEAPARASRTRVFFIDDDHTMRKIATVLLRQLGCEAFVAASGADALAIVRAGGQPIDLLITDVVMAEMSGPENARAVSAELPGIKVLYVTGHSADSLALRGISLDGQHRHLCKPFTIESLHREIKSMLDE